MGWQFLPARVRSPKDKAAEGTVGIISTFALTALRNCQFLSQPGLNEAVYECLKAFKHKRFLQKEGNRIFLYTVRFNAYFMCTKNGLLQNDSFATDPSPYRFCGK